MNLMLEQIFAAMGDYLRHKDPTRVVHYEGVTWNREFDYITDIESRMYANHMRSKNILQTSLRNHISHVNTCMLWGTQSVA